MAINPAIPLGVQPPQQQPGLLSRLGQMQQLQAQKQSMDFAQQQNTRQETLFGQQQQVNQQALEAGKLEEARAKINTLADFAVGMETMSQPQRQARAQQMAQAYLQAGDQGLAQLLTSYEWSDEDVQDLSRVAIDAKTRFEAMQPSSEQQQFEERYREWLPTFGGRDTPENRQAFRGILRGEEVEQERALAGAKAQPPASLQEYYVWKEQKLKEDPNANVSLVAFEKEMAGAKGASGGNLQSELATLRQQELQGALTTEGKARKDGIEYAMGYVANQYGSGYQLMSLPDGTSIVVQKSTGQPVGTVPEGIRPQFTAAEREEIGGLDEIVTQMGQLRTLGNDHRGSIGWGAGTLADWEQRYVGEGLSLDEQEAREVSEMFRISDGIADLLLRARSGAQINEQEYQRLRLLTPNPRLGETKFFSDLDSFDAEMRRILGRRSGSAPLVTPESERPGPASRGSQVGEPDSFTLPDGTVVTRQPDGTYR